jgi:hypothetical protein
MHDRRIILSSGPGPTVIMTIDPPFEAGRRHLFPSLSSARGFAAELNEITDWPIVECMGDPSPRPS